MKTLFPFVLGLVVAALLLPTQEPSAATPVDCGDQFRLEARQIYAELAEEYRIKGEKEYSAAFRVAWWMLTKEDDPPAKEAACPEFSGPLKNWLQDAMLRAPME